MFNIQKYLDRLSKNLDSTELNKNKIIEIIKKKTEITLTPQDFEIKDLVINIKSSPAVKNKMFIFKAKILEEIDSVLGIKILDIR